jgi:MYXO-CTERM domain-containing protein
MKKTLLYAALAAATVMSGGVAQADTIEALTQYCPEGNVFIPSSKICGTTLDTTVNGIPVLVTLNATTYHPGINQVEYNLLNPILVTIPGSDEDQVKINKVSIFLDPVLKFEASFTDFAEPSPFNLTFTSFPFAPTVSIASSLSGSLTDGSMPKNGVSFTTPGLVKYDFLDATGTSVDSFNLGSQASFPAGPQDGSGDSHIYGPFSGRNILTCDTVGCGSVKLSLAFTGSGGGDRYDFTSRSDVTVPEQVPEPSATGPLALLGLAGLWSVRKRLSH